MPPTVYFWQRFSLFRLFVLVSAGQNDNDQIEHHIPPKVECTSCVVKILTNTMLTIHIVRCCLNTIQVWKQLQRGQVSTPPCPPSHPNFKFPLGDGQGGGWVQITIVPATTK
jgi:hypothetical protein